MNKLDGLIHIFCKAGLGIIVNGEAKPATVQVAVSSSLASCSVDSNPDAVERLGSVLSQSLSDPVSHGICSPRFRMRTKLTVSTYAFSAPCVLTYRSKNHRVS